MARKDVLGRSGEDLAADHLIAQGFTIVDRNWRCQMGEIDIIARDGPTTVMVEVKTRSGTGYGHPLEAITPIKLARMRRVAAVWCSENGPVEQLRIDAIAIVASPDTLSIDHVRQVA